MNCVMQVNAPTVQCTVKNLKPGHLYRFEVSAINKEGESLPTQTKDPVKAESPYSKSPFHDDHVSDGEVGPTLKRISATHVIKLGYSPNSYPLLQPMLLS